MELLFRGIARAGGIEVPTEVRIFETPQRKPRENRLSTSLAEAAQGLVLRLKGLADRRAGPHGPASGRAVAP